ncbi:MAG: discoidin domain-containing protein [Deltaproteobacteria bacterium]|nr:discoidin domain-containing protein [Deltaproteobacteria bacterium]
MKPIKYPSFIYLLIFLLFGAGIRFLLLLTPFMDSDQAVNGLMARHILGGEFPFFFYGQDYCGSIEAYLISTIFFFLGASRFTLNAAIGLESLFFILSIYFLARAVSDQKTALLSALFAALPSYYLVFHSVLARSAYIEIPIIGVLLFIISHKIVYRDETAGRNFFWLGFLCGLGMWTHFLIIYYLPPIFLLLFIKDRWFWGRRTTFFLILGLILGGLPLWVHNSVHPLVTWHYLRDTSGGAEPVLTSLKDFFLFRFPEALGLRNNETERFTIPFFFPALYLIYLASFVFLLVYAKKAFVNLCKLKIEKDHGRVLLLLFLFLFPLIFSVSGFASGHTSRYLMPLFSVLPILLALFTQTMKSFSLTLACLFLGLHLFSNVFGTMSRLPLISDTQRTQHRQARENDQNLFAFLMNKNIQWVYTPEYWLSVRLTFDAQEKIIFASPAGDRYPKYTEWIDRDFRPAFLFLGDNRVFEETLKNIGGTYTKSQVFGYSIYHGFTPPPFRFIELNPAPFTAAADSNPIKGLNIFDRDLTTRWSSHIPQKPGLFLQVDLGALMPDLGRITLLSGKAEDAPRGLRLEISPDGRNWQTVRETAGLWSDFFWSGSHPFYRPGLGRVDITFPPRSGRFIRFTQIGSDPTYYWSVAECYIYQALPETQQPFEDLNFLTSRLKSLKTSNIITTPWVQSHLPPEWGILKKRLQNEKGTLVQTVLNPVLVVEKEKASTLNHFLKNILKLPYQEQEISRHKIYYFYPAFGRYRPISSTSWRFHTNYNRQMAPLAADGKLSTRWTTGRPQIPGAYFQIDLGKLQRVARIRVLTGDSVHDFPREYSIHYSADGQAWTPLNSHLGPVSLYWTGETLLKDSQDLDFTFPSTPMRYIQIVQTGQDDIFYWSIHEVEIYDLK